MSTLAYIMIIIGAATVARTLMRIIEAVDKQ